MKKKTETLSESTKTLENQEIPKVKLALEPDLKKAAQEAGQGQEADEGNGQGGCAPGGLHGRAQAQREQIGERCS